MAKKRSSFATSVVVGIPSAPGEKINNIPSDISTNDLNEEASNRSTQHPNTPDNSTDSSSTPKDTFSHTSGVNPYYDYHPKRGVHGGTLGAPRAKIKRVQISIGCTEEEKKLYNAAAIADGRKLPDLVKRAVLEYIENHNLNILI